MSPQVPNTFVFRWRSLFGVAVALFLLYGAFNVLSAVVVPVSLRLGRRWRGEQRTLLGGSFPSTRAAGLPFVDKVKPEDADWSSRNRLPAPKPSDQLRPNTDFAARCPEPDREQKGHDRLNQHDGIEAPHQFGERRRPHLTRCDPSRQRSSA